MGKDGQRPLDERIGRLLILAGVAVWPAYVVLRWLVGLDLDAKEVLPFHLAGVIPGAILARWRWLRGLVRRQRP
ncbi:MAG: hypothetical protein HY683_03555 [Chloroflexi bacterium]|nr:hypothetical protein [Chloroflexota bacterium]